jgi:hypothetical protein
LAIIDDLVQLGLDVLDPLTLVDRLAHSAIREYNPKHAL